MLDGAPGHQPDINAGPALLTRSQVRGGVLFTKMKFTFSSVLALVKSRPTEASSFSFWAMNTSITAQFYVFTGLPFSHFCLWLHVGFLCINEVEQFSSVCNRPSMTTKTISKYLCQPPLCTASRGSGAQGERWGTLLTVLSPGCLGEQRGEGSGAFRV